MPFTPRWACGSRSALRQLWRRGPSGQDDNLRGARDASSQARTSRRRSRLTILEQPGRGNRDAAGAGPVLSRSAFRGPNGRVGENWKSASIAWSCESDLRRYFGSGDRIGPLPSAEPWLSMGSDTATGKGSCFDPERLPFSDSGSRSSPVPLSSLLHCTWFWSRSTPFGQIASVAMATRDPRRPISTPWPRGVSDSAMPLPRRSRRRPAMHRSSRG